MSSSRKRKSLPPFADHIPQSAKSVLISAGPRAWARARRWKWEGHPGLVADPAVDPGAVHWPITGYNVALIATGMSQPDLVRLVVALRSAKPAVIAVLHGPDDHELMDILRARNG